MSENGDLRLRGGGQQLVIYKADDFGEQMNNIGSK